jgi:aryl-alcohol dehydrogenase-like predicted oxidoreductase
MRYRTLGKSGIKVSEIGFGAWTIGLDWWGKKIDDDEAIRMLKRAYDLGINFFETADIYGKGKSEKLIAQVFKDMRNHKSITKNFCSLLLARASNVCKLIT